LGSDVVVAVTRELGSNRGRDVHPLEKLPCETLSQSGTLARDLIWAHQADVQEIAKNNIGARPANTSGMKESKWLSKIRPRGG